MTVETCVYPLDADMMCIYIIFFVCNDPSMSNLIESLLFGVFFRGGLCPKSHSLSRPQQERGR